MKTSLIESRVSHTCITHARASRARPSRRSPVPPPDAALARVRYRNALACRAGKSSASSGGGIPAWRKPQLTASSPVGASISSGRAAPAGFSAPRFDPEGEPARAPRDGVPGERDAGRGAGDGGAQRVQAGNVVSVQKRALWLYHRRHRREIIIRVRHDAMIRGVFFIVCHCFRRSETTRLEAVVRAYAPAPIFLFFASLPREDAKHAERVALRFASRRRRPRDARAAFATRVRGFPFGGLAMAQRSKHRERVVARVAAHERGAPSSRLAAERNEFAENRVARLRRDDDAPRGSRGDPAARAFLEVPGLVRVRAVPTRARGGSRARREPERQVRAPRDVAGEPRGTRAVGMRARRRRRQRPRRGARVGENEDVARRRRATFELLRRLRRRHCLGLRAPRSDPRPDLRARRGAHVGDGGRRERRARSVGGVRGRFRLALALGEPRAERLADRVPENRRGSRRSGRAGGPVARGRAVHTSHRLSRRHARPRVLERGSVGLGPPRRRARRDAGPSVTGALAFRHRRERADSETKRVQHDSTARVRAARGLAAATHPALERRRGAALGASTTRVRGG